MKEILVVCSSMEYKEDLDMACVTGEKEINLTTMDNVEGLENAVSKRRYDLVLLSYDALKTRDSWNLGDNVKIAYFAESREELDEGSVYGLPTLGVAKYASDLYEKLDTNPYMPRNNAKKQNNEKQAQENKHPVRKPVIDFSMDDEDDELIDPFEKAEAAKKTERNEPERDKQRSKPDLKKGNSTKTDEKRSDNRRPEERKPEERKPEEKRSPVKEKPQPKVQDNFEELDDDLDFLEEENEEQELEPQAEDNYEVEESEEQPKEKVDDVIEREFLKDTNKGKRKTKVITVYSAKGGVGKTTIATEIATYLSLVNVGRNKLRVCLVDYNIDFGDVRGTLNLKEDGSNLTYWAGEVQERLEKGADKIVYSQSDIEKWLRVDKRTGLYVLPAPITNEDSMGIESEALSIILKNIIDHGGFDYIICDTGNNTRDSTMIALQNADMIFMIMTQNVNTANCDKAFMETMEAIDFDLSKNTKLVINNIMPQKSTGVSVTEIVNYFPYECVGKIKFDTDVVKATNVGVPLAYSSPDHPFTKQLRSIVSYILQVPDEDVSTDKKKKKKRIFGFLFK